MVKLDPPVIGILRGISAGFFGPLMDAAFDAGLQAIEVTLNTPQAEAMITSQRPRVPPGRLLGMGTIRNQDEAKRAFDAGAMFLVTPNTDERVIDFALVRSIPVVCGAFTPTEVYKAWVSGAAMIKVFPCSQLGPRYIRDLLGPLDNIPLVAVGGVNQDNVGAYLEAGACAVGVGGALFGRQAIAEERAADIRTNVGKFLERTRKQHVA
jgi:2-dehydro-3-deoxyphosphogluconate aldolase / (4S)-4-hydroxy-2-oxoglutarate aldolase